MWTSQHNTANPSHHQGAEWSCSAVGQDSTAENQSEGDVFLAGFLGVGFFRSLDFLSHFLSHFLSGFPVRHLNVAQTHLPT